MKGRIDDNQSEPTIKLPIVFPIKEPTTKTMKTDHQGFAKNDKPIDNKSRETDKIFRPGGKELKVPASSFPL